VIPTSIVRDYLRVFGRAAYLGVPAWRLARILTEACDQWLSLRLRTLTPGARRDMCHASKGGGPTEAPPGRRFSEGGEQHEAALTDVGELRPAAYPAGCPPGPGRPAWQRVVHRQGSPGPGRSIGFDDLDPPVPTRVPATCLILQPQLLFASLIVCATGAGLVAAPPS
jgi:hypothetical protein